MNQVIKYCCIIGILMMSFSVNAMQADTTHKCFLVMQGVITFEKKKLDDVSIAVFIDSSQFKTFATDSRGRCSFDLPLQHFFKIKISKQGLVTKIITADTHVPKNEIGNYLLDFSINLFEEVNGLDVSILKYPVAKVFFNTFLKKFDHDYNYTIKINNDLKKMYDEYYILKRKK